MLFGIVSGTMVVAFSSYDSLFFSLFLVFFVTFAYNISAFLLNALVFPVHAATKKNAEHAVAARVLDCLRMRENMNDLSPRLCMDAPYLNVNDAPPLPVAVTALLTSSDPLPTLKIRKLPKILSMETDEEVQNRREYQLSRTWQ